MPKEIVYDEIFAIAVFKHDVIEIHRKLKTNYRIALFPIIKVSWSEKCLCKIILFLFFDEILISSDHKMVKPDPAYFNKLLSILNASSDEVVFIDDAQVNVDTGNKLGIKSLLFTNAGVLEEELRSLGVKL